MIRSLAVLATLALLAQPAAGQFGLNPKQITSYWHGPEGLIVERMYSTFVGGVSTFYYFLQNREDGGVPVDASPYFCSSDPDYEGECYSYLWSRFEAGSWLFHDLIGVGRFTYGRVTAVGSPGVNFRDGMHDDDYATLDYYAYATGYYGFTLPANVDNSVLDGYWQTCLSRDEDGWVALTFSVSGRHDLTEVAFPRSGDVHVTPEPLTLILFGSGLAGLTGIWSRGRKRNSGQCASGDLQ